MNLSYASAATAKLIGSDSRCCLRARASIASTRSQRVAASTSAGRRPPTLGSAPTEMLVRALLVALVLVLLPGAAHDSTERLTLEEQVGQLVVMSFRGTNAPEYVLAALREKRSAGVILFGGNVGSPGQLRALTGSLRRAGGRPLVAVDQEGGRVRRVPWAGLFAPSRSRQLRALCAPTPPQPRVSCGRSGSR